MTVLMSTRSVYLYHYMQYYGIPLLGRGVVLPCVLSEDVYCVHVQDAWYTVLHICMLERMQYVYVSVIPCLYPTGLLCHPASIV